MWKKAFCAVNKLLPLLVVPFIKHNKKAPDIISEYNIPYGDCKLQRYDLHTKRGDNALPTIFYIHGGSWMSMDKRYYTMFLKTIAEQGYRVVNINYRLLPKVTLKEVIGDCENAISHALNNIAPVDKSKLIIIGDSAGAHLAALIAAKSGSGLLPYKFIAAGAYYGLVDINDMYNSDALLFKLLTKYFMDVHGDNYKEYLRECSPLEFFNENFPPVFVTSGKVDSLNSASMSFIKHLKDKNIKHRALIFEKDRKDAMHGFLNMYFLKSSKEALSALLEFLYEIVS